VLPVYDFILNLSESLICNAQLLIKHGFEGMKPKIESKLEFKGQEVVILDEKLDKELHRGVFKGINEFGHAFIVK